MDIKLLFVDSGAAAVQLSTKLRGKDYFRSNFGNLAILTAIRRASSLVRSFLEYLVRKLSTLDLVALPWACEATTGTTTAMRRPVCFRLPRQITMAILQLPDLFD
jgi:hypothetical protein